MVPTVFARIGWMRWYRGPQMDDEKPIGGGSYTKRSVGHEAFNFLPLDGQMYGYFQPRLQPATFRGKHPSTIALERIEAGFAGDALDGVLVVFVATDPKLGGQRIVGWYRDATVYRHDQPSKDKRRNSFSYFLKARAEDAKLVLEKRRSFVIPAKGKGAFGRANVRYVLDMNGDSTDRVQWMDEVLKYVDSYELEDGAREPETEVDPDIEQTLQSTIERIAGFQSNPRIRKAIEMYAMKKAKQHLEKLADKLEDTHKTKSYDFLCTVSGKELFVEVKGTQDDGNSVSLTPKEVDHARNHANSALFIVHSVKIKGKRNPVISGGKERFINPWDISTGTLKERGFIYTLSTNA